MFNPDDNLAQEYLAECFEHLATVEPDLLAIEMGGIEVDEELVNRVFRGVHSIKGGAAFFDLMKINNLAHQMEDIMGLIRSHKILPTPDRVSVLLRGTDRLQDLLRNACTSEQADIAEIMADLGRASADEPAPDGQPELLREPGTSDRAGNAEITAAPTGLPVDPEALAEKACVSVADPAFKGARRLRALLVEDDFTNRLLLQTFLIRYGECHIAANGREAVEAFRSALESGQKYDLICMDIMMPEMDGQTAVREIRALEEARGTRSTQGAKIIMTTALFDVENVVESYKALCDAYLCKPIRLGELLGQMKEFHLV